MRGVPIFTFINKMDREARDPYELLEDIENELGIGTYAVNWPIGSGKRFKGVYDRMDDEVIAFEGADFRHEVKAQRLSIDDPILEGLLPEDQYLSLIHIYIPLWLYKVKIIGYNKNTGNPAKDVEDG